MGEYALYGGERVKIGTCESMYYLRADQRRAVTPEPGNVDPVRDRHAIRFRFPFPSEDDIEPGAFETHERGLRLDGVQAPADLAHEHYSVQFSARNGYLVSIPCPEGADVPDGLKVHRNGYGGAVELIQQKYVQTDAGDQLVSVCQCKGCGLAWRLQTLEDAAPALDALEEMAVREDRTAEQNDTPGNAAIARMYREVARRIVAGYGAQD